MYYISSRRELGIINYCKLMLFALLLIQVHEDRGLTTSYWVALLSFLVLLVHVLKAR